MTPTRWPQWTGYAAAAWSTAYALLGLLWTLGGPGYPFGENDIPDARAESALGATTVTGAAPWIAALGVLGTVVGLALARARRGRVPLALLGGAFALGLVVVIPDQRPLVAVAYLPLVVVGTPFGWPDEDFGMLMGKLLPGPVLHLMLIQVGGLLFAAATVAFLRRGRDACGTCGRVHGTPARWTTPVAAARWGRIAAIAAVFAPLGYAVVRWAWVFHVPIGMSSAEIDELHRSGLVWAGAYLATFAALGGVLTLGLFQRWGEVWPRWVLGLRGKKVPPALPITAAAVVTVTLSSTVVPLVRLNVWSLQNPMTLWPLWAAALGAATLGYYYRTRGACQACTSAAGWPSPFVGARD
jgi:hypothetical protein